MDLRLIQLMPTTLDNVYESCYRSYHILERVLEMIERGDSKDSIFELVAFLKEYPAKHETVTVNEEMNKKKNSNIREVNNIEVVGNCANCGVEYHIHKL